jgi:hypothetical protein
MMGVFLDRTRGSIMAAAAPAIDRDVRGRFRPGSSGNPAGKKPGTRNRATILKEALRDGEDTTVARIVIDKALAGDAVAARFLLERLEPKPRGRPIHLEIPQGESPAGEVVATFNAALRAMAAGEITPDEALSVARFLEGRTRVLKAWQLEQKLTRWDNPLPIPGDDRPSPIPYPPPAAPAAPTGKPTAPPKPSSKPKHISSPPAKRGEKDAEGWRGQAEPYPKLDEGGAAAGKVSDKSRENPSAGASTPHPAPAKLGSASLSLRNPLPQGERENPPAGDKKLEHAKDAPPLDLLAAVPPELRRETGIGRVPARLLHSTCISGAPPLRSAAWWAAAEGRPRSRPSGGTG